jgi:hypothetical protein
VRVGRGAAARRAASGERGPEADTHGGTGAAGERDSPPGGGGDPRGPDPSRARDGHPAGDAGGRRRGSGGGGRPDPGGRGGRAGAAAEGAGDAGGQPRAADGDAGADGSARTDGAGGRVRDVDGGRACGPVDGGDRGRAGDSRPPRLREGLGATSDTSGRVLAASGAAGLAPREAGARWVDELRDVLVPGQARERLAMRVRMGREVDMAGNLAAGLAVAVALERAVAVAAGDDAADFGAVLVRVRALHPAVERALGAVVWTGSASGARALGIGLAAGLGAGLELDRAAALAVAQVAAVALRRALGDDADLAAYPDAITVSPERLVTPRLRALGAEFERARTALRAADGIRTRLRAVAAALEGDPVRRGAAGPLARALAAALAAELLSTVSRLRGLPAGLRLTKQLTDGAGLDKVAALAETLAEIRTALSDVTTADLSGIDLYGEPLQGLRWSSRTVWPRDMWTQVRAASVEIEPDLYEIRADPAT